MFSNSTHELLPMNTSNLSWLVSVNFESEKELEKINSACFEIYKWIMENVVGEDVYPRSLPDHLQTQLKVISSSSEEIKNHVSYENNKKRELIMNLIMKKPLTKEELYFAKALGVIPALPRREFHVHTKD